MYRTLLMRRTESERGIQHPTCGDTLGLRPQQPPRLLFRLSWRHWTWCRCSRRGHWPRPESGVESAAAVDGGHNRLSGELFLSKRKEFGTDGSECLSRQTNAGLSSLIELNLISGVHIEVIDAA